MDNSTSPYAGAVYVSWTRFTKSGISFTNPKIVLSWSRDQGLSWTTPMTVSTSAQTGNVQGSQVAVGPDGTVYVVYEVYGSGSTRTHWLAKYTPSASGLTFVGQAAITPSFNELSFNSTYRKNSFASLAIAPTQDASLHNVLYVVYADQPSTTLGAEVEFVKITDNGGTSLTVTPPRHFNNSSTGHQFMPAVAVDNVGAIHASWFDTRNNGGTTKYDIYATPERSPFARWC